MEYEIAHKIIKSKNGISFTATDWKFIKEGQNILIFSELLGFTTTISSSLFLDYYILPNRFTFNGGSIVGEFLYSSVGLITEEEYYLAEDLIKNGFSIPLKDLEANYIYKANNGKSYIYVHDVGSKLLSFNKVTGDFYKEDEDINYLIEIKDDIFGRVIKYRPEIKLLSKEEFFDDKEFIIEYILEHKIIYFEEIDDIKVVMRYIDSGSRKVYLNPFEDVYDSTCVVENDEYYWRIDYDLIPDDVDIVKIDAYYSSSYGFHTMRVNKFKFAKDIFLFLNSSDKVYNVSNAFYDDEYYEIVDCVIPF